eukprot:3706331-Amphidinium_carterae.1
MGSLSPHLVDKHKRSEILVSHFVLRFWCWLVIDLWASVQAPGSPDVKQVVVFSRIVLKGSQLNAARSHAESYLKTFSDKYLEACIQRRSLELEVGNQKETKLPRYCTVGLRQDVCTDASLHHEGLVVPHCFKNGSHLLEEMHRKDKGEDVLEAEGEEEEGDLPMSQEKRYEAAISPTHPSSSKSVFQSLWPQNPHYTMPKGI